MQLKIHILPNIISSANFKIYSVGHKSIFRLTTSNTFDVIWLFIHVSAR